MSVYARSWRHSAQRRTCVLSTAILYGLLILGNASSTRASQLGPFDCVIEPRLKIELAAPTAGVLAEVLVDRGDRVRKGEIVAKLDSTVEQATVELDKARAASGAAVASRRARAKFLALKNGRLLKLQSPGTIAQAELDEAAADLAVANADLAEAQEQQKIAHLEYERSLAILNQRSIRSPIDGLILERKLSGGEYAFDQAPIMVVAEVNPLNVEVYLPVTSLEKIHTGTNALVHLAAPLSGDYTAIVEVVDTVSDARSGTYGVRLKLPNPEYRTPAGVRCEVEFPDETISDATAP
jgi:RND family efflux transporter MFP subunit